MARRKTLPPQLRKFQFKKGGGRRGTTATRKRSKKRR